MAITIATTTVMSINTKASILESLPLSRGPAFDNGTFHFDCGINLGNSGIGIVECGGLLLRPLSEDLFSARVWARQRT